MSNNKKDKLEVSAFKPIETFHVGNIVKSIREQSSQFQDTIDLVTNDRSIRISDNRGKIAKDAVKFAEKTILAYQEPEKLGKLTPWQQREILGMINDLLSGKRECVHFQMNRNCDGIKELFSNREFSINQSDQEK
jgi:hypothetical protein